MLKIYSLVTQFSSKDNSGNEFFQVYPFKL